jgi:DNA-binding XRE family transcriptional regulator
MFGDMLKRDRTRWGLSVGQAAWRVGVSPAVYREIEAGTRWPSFETYDRICELFGWPQAFVGKSGQVAYK